MKEIFKKLFDALLSKDYSKLYANIEGGVLVNVSYNIESKSTLERDETIQVKDTVIIILLMWKWLLL